MPLPAITVITPSIRPEGLKIVEKSLEKQTFRDFEWIPKLDKPGYRSTLCKAFNGAIRDAKGALVIFVQDYIALPSTALVEAMEAHRRYPESAYTFPVGKVDKLDYNDSDITWDWRLKREQDQSVSYAEWEIDYGMIPTKFLRMVGGFDEEYDQGFGWENVDIAYRMYLKGVHFRVDPTVKGVAWDHDKYMEHPYKKNPNNKLWLRKSEEITEDTVKLRYL